MPGMPVRWMIVITLAGTAVLASLVLIVWRDKGILTVRPFAKNNFRNPHKRLVRLFESFIRRCK